MGTLDPKMNGTGPLDRHDPSSVFEPGREVHDAPAELVYKRARRRKIAVRTLAAILIAVLAFLLLYSIFVHPVNKLKHKLAIYDRYTVSLRVSESGYAYKGTPRVKVMVDGDTIAVSPSKYSTGLNRDYYKLKGDSLYKHWGSSGWRLVVPIPEMENEEHIPKLLDRKNYEWVFGWLFIWQIEEGVELGTMENVQIRNKWGKTILAWTQDGKYYTLTFEKFGTTHVNQAPEWK